MKKLITIILLLALSLILLCACKEDTPPDSDTNQTDTNHTNNDDTPAEPESAVSDFEYETNEAGGITIKKYKGSEANVVIPEKIDGKDVTCIGDGAFYWKATLVSVKIPNGVTNLDKNAFFNCFALTTVDMPSTVTTIGNGCFAKCISLTNIMLPADLVEIGAHAFSECQALKNISIPQKVITLGISAFELSGLQTLSFASDIKLENIPERAFSSCPLTEITLPDSVTTIGDMAFGACYSLSSIILGNKVVSIDEQAFAGATIREIVLPATLQNMHDRAFDGCAQLQSIKFEGNAPTVQSNEFFDPKNVSYTFYHHANATGFTSPTWCGYPSALW